MTIAYEYRPDQLYLNVTNRCSNDCRFCVRQGPDYSLAGYDLRLAGEPGVAEVLADIQRLESERGEPFDEVVFCGFGEPTYRLELIGEVGRALRKRAIPVRLNTNGQAALITGTDPFPIMAEALDTVSISLNAPDAESYVQLCRPEYGAMAYEALLEFARRSHEQIDNVVLTVVGFTLSAHDIARCRRLAESLGLVLRVR